MIIDFHAHMFPDKIAERTISFLASVCEINPYTDGTYHGLKQSGENSSIDISISLPIVTNPAQFDSINRFAASVQDEHIISFGSIHPENSNYKEKLLEIKSMGLKGFKLHPDYQEVYFNDIRYKRIVSFASELGLIVVSHAGIDPKSPKDVHCTVEMAREMIDEVQPEKLVLAHMGGLKLWDKVEEQLVGQHVYFDTGVSLDAMPEEQFVRIMQTHGSDKILFGTDSPWAGQKEYVERLYHIDIAEEERNAIFYQNAAKLLCLS